MARDKKKPGKKPKVNPDLEDFDVEVGAFGELKTSYKIEDLNEFLNKRLPDKKLSDRKDYKEIQTGKKKKNKR